MKDLVPDGLKRVHPIIVERAENATVWDAEGSVFTDFIGGIGVLVTGHRHPRVIAAVKEQIGRLTHACFNATPHRGYFDLAERLNEIVPVAGPCRTMLTNSGAEAWENALKITRAATGRSGVIAFEGGFHGRTLATVALNGKSSPYKTGLGPLPGPVLHAPYACRETGVTTDEALAAIDRMLSVSVPPDAIGAVAIEPVQGEGGFAAARGGFLQGLRALCDRHAWLLIVDEVQSGWYRTGRRFGVEHSGVTPDIVIMAKGLAGGFPLGALTGRAAVMNRVVTGGLGGTYSGNPVAVAAALAVLDVLEDEGYAGKVERIAKRIEAAHARYRETMPKAIGPLRGRGAMRAFAPLGAAGAAEPAVTARIVSAARETGLLLMTSGKAGEIIRLLMPLSIPLKQLDDGLRLLGRILARRAGMD